MYGPRYINGLGDPVQINFRKLINQIRNATDEELEHIRLNTDAYQAITDSNMTTLSTCSTQSAQSKFHVRLNTYLEDFKSYADQAALRSKMDVKNKLTMNGSARNAQFLESGIDSSYDEIKKEAEKLVATALQIVDETAQHLSLYDKK